MVPPQGEKPQSSPIETTTTSIVQVALKDILVDDTRSPLENACNEELRARVETELKSVRTVSDAVILRDIEELSYEQIAEVMEVSLGTVKSRLVRGREALRKRLERHLSCVWVEVPERGKKQRASGLSAARKSRSCHEMLGCEAAHVVIPGRCGYAQRVDCIRSTLIPALRCATRYLALRQPRHGVSSGTEAGSGRPGSTIAGCRVAGNCQRATVALGDAVASAGKTCLMR